MKLVLERNPTIVDKTVMLGNENAVCMVTPPAIGEIDYWAFRVRLSPTQSIVAFPKFCTLGIGFWQETDWNTNLPCQSGPERIWKHIQKNKGDDSIRDEDCLEALKMICEASVAFLKEQKKEQDS